MGFIDADAHVIETAQTWNFMLEEERRFAPELLVSAINGVEFWPPTTATPTTPTISKRSRLSRTAARSARRWRKKFWSIIQGGSTDCERT